MINFFKFNITNKGRQTQAFFKEKFLHKVLDPNQLRSFFIERLLVRELKYYIYDHIKYLNCPENHSPPLPFVEPSIA